MESVEQHLDKLLLEAMQAAAEARLTLGWMAGGRGPTAVPAPPPPAAKPAPTALPTPVASPAPVSVARPQKLARVFSGSGGLFFLILAVLAYLWLTGHNIF